MASVAIKDNYPVTECDNCGGDCHIYDIVKPNDDLSFEDPSDPTSYLERSVDPHEYVPVERGFCLDLSGHYGGFTDAMGPSGLHRVVLCHDCSANVARALPGIFRSGRGHHSMFSDEEHTSCCEFAWTFDPDSPPDEDGRRVVMTGDGSGGWVARPEE